MSESRRVFPFRNSKSNLKFEFYKTTNAFVCLAIIFLLSNESFDSFFCQNVALWLSWLKNKLWNRRKRSRASRWENGFPAPKFQYLETQIEITLLTNFPHAKFFLWKVGHFLCFDADPRWRFNSVGFFFFFNGPTDHFRWNCLLSIQIDHGHWFMKIYYDF